MCFTMKFALDRSLANLIQKLIFDLRKFGGY